jgi:lipoyl-dependent peroxiredoxin
MSTSSAEAVWDGGKTGKGHFRAASGAFRADYSVPTRFEGKPGTNPEELIAAAHAACLSMALALGLDKAGTPATRITTSATCTIERAGDGFRITTMRLEVRGVVPGLDQAAFGRAAEGAKQGCPVSNALMNNVKLELDARLES